MTIGASITDSDILRCNRKLLLNSEGGIAERVWMLAKDIGVSVEGDDSRYIAEIHSMENRDREARLQRGEQSSFP